MTWKYWTPERDGHAPDDWVEGLETEFQSETPGVWNIVRVPTWSSCFQYRYRPLQDATVEPSFDTLKDQCLRLPQDQREALIEAMQKPQRDWADEVWAKVNAAYLSNNAYQSSKTSDQVAAAVIRSMCRPKDVTDALVTMLRDVRAILPVRYTTAQKPLYDALDALIREALS